MAAIDAISAAPVTTPDIAPEKLAELQALVESRRPGFSLTAPFYTDRQLFDLDMRAIFGQHWLFAGSIAELPEPGDYITVDFGPYALILLHHDDGSVRALHNVCRHRGARILTEDSGTTGNLVCGYHSWTYAPSGELIHASAPGEIDFDAGCFALKRAHCRVVGGLIFVCTAAQPPEDFDEVAEILRPYVEPHELGATKVAYQQDIVEQGNWKLVMGNSEHASSG